MILVTGGSGFIGSHLVETLQAQGEKVRCFVRRPAAPHGVESAHGDLVSGQGIEAALRAVDTVIHLAGVTRALKNADYYSGNAVASENLARAVAKDPAIRMVHVSSLAAIGPSRDGMPVREDTNPAPVSEYGKSKLRGEELVRQLLPSAVIVRPPVVYGPRDTDVFQILRSVSRGFIVQLAGEERWFSAIYVRDLVEGILSAARSPQAAGRAYFLAHPQPITWQRFAAAASQVIDRPLRAVTVPVPAARTVAALAEAWSRLTGTPGIISRDKVTEAVYSHWTCETGPASVELGFTASTSIEDGLAATLAWYRESDWLSY